MQPRDPRQLYVESVEPRPDGAEYQRRGAQAGLATALSIEGVVILVIFALGRTLVLFGLVDGIDEICGCVALMTAGLLSFAGWSLGGALGFARYRRAVREWEARRFGPFRP